MAKEKETPKQPTVDELGERIGKAVSQLKGNISEGRRDSVISHLIAVASNLEADVADLKKGEPEKKTEGADLKKGEPEKKTEGDKK